MNDLLHTKPGETALSAEEIEGLRFKHITTHGELNQLEQANIDKGLQWLKKQRTPAILEESFLRKLHLQLFGAVWNWAGDFRTTEKNIGIDPLRIPVELRQLMDNTRYQIEHTTYPPRELAARHHHRLLQIHPFPNGNGRWSRITTNTLLESINEVPIDWSGGKTIDEMPAHRRQYIDALRQADAHDFSALLTFVDT